ncbi:MAG: DUF4430 domain-containing protein [Phycisphaeraceae bacterium]|nr:DUF4430 domain-containing protein [Phycisphaeraceae bacterium]
MTSRESSAPTSRVLSLVVLPLACVALALAIAFGDGRPAAAGWTADGVVSRSGSEEEGTPPAEEAKRTVTVVVDYGDGVRKVFYSLAWKDEMTVLDALKLADDHPRGIDVDFTGTGSSAFIRRIDDLANGTELPEGKGKGYWMFRVDGEMSKRSAGVVAVAAGGEVVWFFGPVKPATFEGVEHVFPDRK